MLEKFMILIIQELGPTGLLIVGLYFVFNKHLAKICIHIEQINHNSTKVLEVIERCADQICDKINGKN